jgi:hypothetical protein
MLCCSLVKKPLIAFCINSAILKVSSFNLPVMHESSFICIIITYVEYTYESLKTGKKWEIRCENSD